MERKKSMHPLHFSKTTNGKLSEMRRIVKAKVRKLVLPMTLVLLIASLLSFSSFEVDADPAIGSTTTTIYAVADAYANSSSPDVNYGIENYLYVSSNSNASCISYTYIMFDLLGIPSNANIISAKLKLDLNSTGGEIYWHPPDTIGAYYCSNNSWTELGITWNNKPSFNPDPTDTWSFSIFADPREWGITEDVITALPSGNLTEVLKFEKKTEYGYAVFHSREETNKPKLEVEYTTLPVFVVHLESFQDTRATNNLGLTTFADYTFPLPTDIDVVNGSYQARYSGGYMFIKWETSGDVTVSDAKSVTTTVTVSGNGTLRAVGNAKRLEYTYDHGNPGWGSEKAGLIDAVRFSSLFSGQLITARFHMYEISPYQPNTFKIHVMDENRDDLITPFEQTPTSKGWFDVDLASYGLRVNEGVDFHVGMEWITDYNPDLGEDRTSPSNRSWHWNGTDWEEETYSDFMIRAVVGTLIDHVIVADGIIFTVRTESNSTVSNFQFFKEEKKFLFNVTGHTDTHGSCNITIPTQLLGGPFNVTFDGQLLSEVLSLDNSTHTWLYFTYLQSEHKIEIVGSTVIPEFPSLLLPLLCIITTLIAVVFRKKLKMTKQQMKVGLEASK